MTNLLDEMLAEAEASLTTADRHALVASRQVAPSEAQMAEALVDSPLPPPTKVFLSASAVVSPLAYAKTGDSATTVVDTTTHCSTAPSMNTSAHRLEEPGESYVKYERGGELADCNSPHPDKQSDQRHRHIVRDGCASISAFGNFIGRTDFGEDPTAKLTARWQGNIDGKTLLAAIESTEHSNFGVAVETGVKILDVAAKIGNTINCGALSILNAQIDQSVTDREIPSAQGMDALTHANSPCVDEPCAKQVSTEDLIEKVDRKIAYFETLARDSRVRAIEEAAAEQSLQEARSRIEASAAKRRSLHHSTSAARFKDDTEEQAQRCLAFGPGFLSLMDLSSNDGKPQDMALKSSHAAHLSDNSTINVMPEGPSGIQLVTCHRDEDVLESGVSKRAAIINDPKSIFGISPVVEVCTPHLAETPPPPKSATSVSGEQKKQELFSDLKCPQMTGRTAGQHSIKSEAIAFVSSEQANTSPLQKSSANSEESKITTSTWAGALACATPTQLGPHVQSGCFSSERQNKDVPSCSLSKSCKEGKTAMILGKLDSFLGSLRSPYGATPELDLSEGSCSFKHEVSDKNNSKQQDKNTVSQLADANSEACASQMVTGEGNEEIERKKRAAQKRAAFLAGINTLMEVTTVKANDQEREGVLIDFDEDAHMIHSLEVRAQHLSNIASCEGSLNASISNKASFGSSPHHSDIHQTSTSSIVEVSVGPQCFDGCMGVHNITVVDMAGNTSSADASIGTSQPHSSLSVDASQTKILDCTVKSLQPALSSQEHAVTVPDSMEALQGDNRVTNRGSKNLAEQKGREKSAGIGIQVKRVRGLITVVDLLPGGPASKHLRKGHIVLQIDGTGLETLPFKSVLAMFRGNPGSNVSLSIVDSASALKSGQEPRWVDVQRYSAPTTSRRQAFATNTVASCVPSTPPSAPLDQKPFTFAHLNRAEISHDSGLCSPYSDPGDVASDIKECALPSPDPEADPAAVSATTHGVISIQALHSRLLERLMGGTIGALSNGQSVDDEESSISGPVSSLLPMTPSNGLTPLPANKARRCREGMLQHHSVADKHIEDEEKFRCLIANTSYGSATQEMPGIANAFKRSVHGTNQEAAYFRRTEFGKRVRSPTAGITHQTSSSSKRTRHDDKTKGPAMYKTASSHSDHTSDARSRPSRSSLPRKPAVPSFSAASSAGCRPTGRSASAPKLRPVLQERSELSIRHARPAVGKSTKHRVCVTINAQSGDAFVASSSSALIPSCSRNPFGVFTSGSQARTASPPSRYLGLKTADQRKSTMSPRSASKLSGRARRSDAGKARQSTLKKSPDQNLQVYADVGRAVTSLVQKLSKTPDADRLPDKEEIIQVLGKLAAASSNVDSDPACAHLTSNTPSAYPTSAAANLRSPNTNDALASTKGTKMRDLTFSQKREKAARQSASHAHRKSIGVQGNKENFPNHVVHNSEISEGGSPDAKAKVDGDKKAVRLPDFGAMQDSSLTFDAVLRSRFGL